MLELCGDIQVRGDVARSLMYMAVSYGTYQPGDGPHLKLSDSPNISESSTTRNISFSFVDFVGDNCWSRKSFGASNQHKRATIHFFKTSAIKILRAGAKI